MIISAVNTLKQNSEPVLSNVRCELEIRERVIRVEEELKNQRELIHQVLHQMDKRFEQVDKRMEQLKHELEKRFEQVDKRFTAMEKQFELVINRLDRFMFWFLMLTCSAVFVVVKLV